jgi:hypothetical protein
MEERCDRRQQVTRHSRGVMDLKAAMDLGEPGAAGNPVGSHQTTWRNSDIANQTDVHTSAYSYRRGTRHLLP